MIWLIIVFALIALTKYLTSIRLRNLRDKIHKDQKDATDLRQLFISAVEKDEILEADRDKLMKKSAALHSVINNLKKPTALTPTPKATPEQSA